VELVTMRPEIVAIGEGMLELYKADAQYDAWHMGVGGDVLNVATHMARLGSPVAFLTALGTDTLSEAMKSRWAAEGIDTSMVLSCPNRLPGLYLIETDQMGERSFQYWRDRSAARSLFNCDGIDNALVRAAKAKCVYLSGITLSIFSKEERLKLIKICSAVRAGGGIVAFDPNYRARGWQTEDEAKDAFAAIASFVTVALPTLTDETTLWGDKTVEACIERWTQHGCKEVVVKLGGDGSAFKSQNGLQVVPALKDICPIDTTGAGDGFNAAYLNARVNGWDILSAVTSGNRLGGHIVEHRGAIAPLDFTRPG